MAGASESSRGTPDKALLAAGPDCPYAESIDERGMKFVRVCAGEFWMGSPEDDKEASDDEKPMHRVALDEFWLGKYEVSNAEYGLD